MEQSDFYYCPYCGTKGSVQKFLDGLEKNGGSEELIRQEIWLRGGDPNEHDQT
jgi:hypothetical protein